MKPHEQRVIDEKSDLDGKLERLLVFVKTPIFRDLPIEERQRLLRQEALMREYSQVLGERISAFKVAA
jgi:hypothetical protein